MTDSHGCYLAYLLSSKCSDKYYVLGVVKSKGKLSQVINDIDSVVKDMNENDLLTVFGGTNDVT